MNYHSVELGRKERRKGRGHVVDKMSGLFENALSRENGTRVTVLLLVLSLGVLTWTLLLPQAHAWNISADPQNQPTAPGGTVTYTISINYDPGEVLSAPLPMIQLVTDPIAGLTISFTPETHILIPFTSTMTVQVDASIQPGPYTIHVYAHPNPGSPFPGPDDKEVAVGLAVLSGPATLLTTDWALSNLKITPSSPSVGDHVAYTVDLAALSTNTPYPQTVLVNTWVDGTDGIGQHITYFGPTGIHQTITFNDAWTATAGTHTLGATADLKQEYNDPDRSNNDVSLTITVGTGPATPFDFSLALSPSSVSVNPGGTANYMILLSYSDPSYSGTTINVQLTGLGPGMDYHLSQSGALTITTSPSTPTGTYTLTVIGSALGVTHQTSGTLTVTQQSTATYTTAATSSVATSLTSAAPFDYSVTVSPSTQSVEIGGSTSYVVSVLPLAGSPVPVSLTVMGLPDDVHSSFTTQSATPPYTSTLNLDLSTSSANAGAYTLTVVATGGGNVKSATATLMIQQKAAQTQTTTAQTTTSGSSWSDALQQNSLLIIAALLALAVVLGVLAMRGRGRRAVAQQMGPSRTCGKCGAQNPASNEFCRSCGNKLKGS